MLCGDDDFFGSFFLGFRVVKVALAVVEDAQPLRDLVRILLKLRLLGYDYDEAGQEQLFLV